MASSRMRGQIGRRAGLASSAGARRFSPRMSIDMAMSVSRCDRGDAGARCGCGAELAALRARLEVLTASVANLVFELRGWRADPARHRVASEQDDRDAVLGALVAALTIAFQRETSWRAARNTPSCGTPLRVPAPTACGLRPPMDQKRSW
jgi:hypothetical protein